MPAFQKVAFVTMKLELDACTYIHRSHEHRQQGHLHCEAHQNLAGVDPFAAVCSLSSHLMSDSLQSKRETRRRSCPAQNQHPKRTSRGRSARVSLLFLGRFRGDYLGLCELFQTQWAPRW